VGGGFGLDLALVERVRRAVASHTRRTPVLRSEWLSRATGADVFLKCENLQVTGSFKVRGALAAISVLSDAERAGGVVTASAGNHGLGLARAAALGGIPCTVVLPQGAPRLKEEGIRAEGSKVVHAPHEGYDDTESWTRKELDSLGGVFVSAFDDPPVMAGNGGTTMLEVQEELPRLDLLVAPCGGGGFLAGAGTVVCARAPRARVVGVNSEASPGMYLSRKEGAPRLTMESRPTLAEGLEGGVGERAYRIGLSVVDDVVLVSEESIGEAMVNLLRRERMVVEGSGAVGVAALLSGRVAASGTVCVVLTGSNVDGERLGKLLGS
jgi:threonine dehydratase